MSEMEFLPKMIGDVITTPRKNLSGWYSIPEHRWVILEKLNERPYPASINDFKEGMGPAFTAGKYRCRLANADNEEKFGFMRIYKQIPFEGTYLENADDRRTQACAARKHLEVEAMICLTENRVSAVPRVCGCRIDKQAKDDLVPDGYIVYLVWEEVEGVSLDYKYFWRLPYTDRQHIRENFKTALSEILKFGYKPCFSTIAKVILNRDTGDVKICGFSGAVRNHADLKFSDHYFGTFSLALTPGKWMRHKSYDRFDLAEDLRFDEETGWRW
ncbi:hypothetical protein N7491_008929 [Penicillium cf. griseofulvum]|uniref:Uncharacterized protein n=1 Tax=Penicillium cf. griseofulvum TaxID=2972120 RepID=A0A9W9JQZ7_9EURO|nr:hypothetical protein N7472_005475 [Penicillium cf. griseofulvum]KAJ5423713.1 hypothetical protein N7491_008929 [Penicillium cf. griseofulvum]